VAAVAVERLASALGADDVPDRLTALLQIAGVPAALDGPDRRRHPRLHDHADRAAEWFLSRRGS
jgi:hypothetical protein